MRTLLPLLALLALTPAVVTAQDAAPPAPTACSAETYRAFDFWIGDWTVTQAGQPAGTNRIERIDNGCALSESWASAAGNFSGHSLNFYDPADGHWHQVWVDSGGTVLRLRGGLEDGPGVADGARVQVMVLRGAGRGADGAEVTNRITWTPDDQGRVRQHWEISRDGETWETVFDGLYVRTEPGAP